MARNDASAVVRSSGRSSPSEDFVPRCGAILLRVLGFLFFVSSQTALLRAWVCNRSPSNRIEFPYPCSATMRGNKQVTLCTVDSSHRPQPAKANGRAKRVQANERALLGLMRMLFDRPAGHRHFFNLFSLPCMCVIGKSDLALSLRFIVGTVAQSVKTRS